MAQHLYENPETGERIRWDEEQGQWVSADQGPSVGQVYEHPESGERIRWTGDQWVPEVHRDVGVTRGEAFNESVDRSLIGTSADMLTHGVPSAIGTGMAGMVGAASGVTGAAENLIRGEPADFMGEVSRGFEGASQTGIVQALQNFPRYGDTIADAVLGFMNKPVNPWNPYAGSILNQQMQEQQLRRTQASELFPGTVAVGNAFGDSLAMLVGPRAPVARLRGEISRRNMDNALKTIRTNVRGLPDDVRDRLEDSFSEKLLPAISGVPGAAGRLTAKVGETGLEAALLALSKEDADPLQAASFAGGAQAAGSAGLLLAEKPIKRLFPAVGGAFILYSLFDWAAPGDQDFFEAKDFAIQKVGAAYLLGGAAALAGAGRLRGRIAANYPRLADAITAIPRNVANSRWAEMTREVETEGYSLSREVMERMTFPGYFNDNQMNALGRAQMSEKEGAFRAEINRLIESSPDFRKKVEALRVRAGARGGNQ